MSESPAPLPVKNGISPNKIWLPNGSWATVFEFFRQRFPQLTKQQCIERFDNNEVCTSDGECLTSRSKYRSETHLYFYRQVENEAIVPFKEKIIFEDDNIVVADKPHFLAVAPSGQYLAETLLVRLRRALKIDELELSHRLDRETAGLVLLTKRAEVRAAYHSLFSTRQISKVYHAVAPHLNIESSILRESRMVNSEHLRMREIDGENNSKTMISIIEKGEANSLYKLQPVTGKKHQLRVHMAALNIPIINDSLYPRFQPKDSTDYNKPLQLLAKSLEFSDPVSKEKRYFESTQKLVLENSNKVAT